MVKRDKSSPFNACHCEAEPKQSHIKVGIAAQNTLAMTKVGDCRAKYARNDKEDGGFSLLEMVVAIFLIAIVLGTVLLLMAANLNVLDKANDIMIANALSQYTIEDVRNIEFPPVYYNRQGRFGDRIADGGTAPPYKEHFEIDPVNDGGDWTPEPQELRDKFIVRRYNFRYNMLGEFIDGTGYDTEITMKHRVDVYVLRKQDKSLILRDTVVISRDGLF